MKEFFDRAYRYRDNPTIDTLYALTVEHAERVAFEYLEKDIEVKVTFSEFDKMVKKTASALDEKFGISSKGQFVGLRADNSLAWPGVFWGLLMSGRKPLLIATGATNDEINQILKNACGETTPLPVITDKKLDGIEHVFIEELFGKGDENYIAGEFGKGVAFCTSGTTGEQKVCFYSEDNIFSQLFAALSIPEQTKDIMYPDSHGDLKILAFLPFYHIFGFVSVLLWYPFFGRTVVFLANIAPLTILSTCQKLGVTHIYSVPLFWNSVYRLAHKKAEDMKGISGRVLKKIIKNSTDFSKGLKVASERAVPKFFLKRLQKKLLGTKVRFMISGGGFISPKVLSLLNGFGYPLHNGFGMTEVGITSVNMTSDAWITIDGNIGKPLHGVEYKIDQKEGENSSELLIKSRQVSSGLMKGGKLVPHESEWYNSKDLAVQDKNGNYHIVGRADDMIKSSSGEKIVPDEIEQYFFNMTGVKRSCVFSHDEKLILVIETEEEITNSFKNSFKEQFDKINQELSFHKQINEAYITNEPFELAIGFKVRRGAVKSAFFNDSSKYALFAGHEGTNAIPKEIIEGVRKIFVESLSLKDHQVGLDDDFIIKLMGDSMAYLSVIMEIEDTFKIKINPEKYGKLRTPMDFAGYVHSVK
ncbi:MAG: AMP-binding protein [Firmicutes bacterium]|nr:AMP-binding protein [Bacillota bacterium]